ncbi:unnamed protein product [Allacma fusca]|uniref:Beta-ketoacyl synthase-like N-terminal domain-containing protein n=1 Tax=Allacma fusca TaxID=39272 RepID=A0A8J2JQ55_9HEXA|nr:unnamed protein product [Allacma fusca]
MNHSGFLLELTHEALIDAGINPFTIRGSKTGVYLGSSGEESMESFKIQNDSPSGYCATGSSQPQDYAKLRK